MTLALLATNLFGAVSCSDPVWEPGPVDTFRIWITRVQALDRSGVWADQDISSPDIEPLLYGQRTKIDINIQVIPETRGFDGFVNVAVVPGNVISLASESADVLRTNIRVKAGGLTPAQVEIEGAYSETRLWVEDVGLQPDPLQTAACDDGIDNDGDGLIDHPQDPGCYLRNDGSEEPGTHAVGVSDPILFANPRIANVQGCKLVPDLERQSVYVDRGVMWVTAVTSNGFYVTDASFMEGACDPLSGCCDEGRYSHIYAFNFNTPYNMRVCDRLDVITGIVGDFYGFTELNFPSWESTDLDPGAEGIQLLRIPPSQIRPEQCELPSFEITSDMLTRRSLMETYEAALVYVRNAMLPRYWVDCDFNGNGEVGYSSATDELTSSSEVTDDQVFELGFCSRTAQYCSEMACNNGCEQLGEGCAELANLREFGQYPILVNGIRVLVVTGANVPNFDPVERSRSGQLRIERLMGTLKEFAPLDNPWIIEPRCRQDIFIAGDEAFGIEVPIHQRCVPSEETGDYEDPY
jgi:hypothetical protein